MRPIVKLAALAAAFWPALAPAQTDNVVQRSRGLPVGIDVPGVSVAGGETPSALGANPAAPGFVEALTLEYFHEGAPANGLAADGAYASVPLGPLVPTLTMEWMRPPSGPKYVRTGLGLALSAAQSASFGISWNWWSSPDAALDGLFTIDLGMTLRPWRHLSLGASVLGLEGRLAGAPLPVRYDFGAATRLLDDALTVSFDALADDLARGSFAFHDFALGAGVELPGGLGLQFQWTIPLHPDRPGWEGAWATQVALVSSAGHASVVGGWGWAGAPELDTRHGWLLGLRASAQRYRGRLPGRETVVLDLHDSIQGPGFRLFGGDPDPYGSTLRRLRQLGDDPHVAALVVRIDGLPVGAARAEELRAELARVRERKPVLAYLGGGGEIGPGVRDYLVATGASAIYAPQATTLFVTGLSSSGIYLREGLAKLGVAFEAVTAGKYKSAPEALTRSDMSPADREARESVLDDRFARLVRTIAEARRLPDARVRELVDVGVFSPEEARAAGLIDGVLWPDEVEAEAKRRAGGEMPVARRYSPAAPRGAQRWGPRPHVALVRIEGTIAAGRSRLGPFGVDAVAGADTVTRQIREVSERGEVRAIVLRVDSPGGDGLASDLMWRAVSEARRKGKPVVVSMGDYAASGGYLAAVGADVLLAEPSTLTGSIGVFAVKPDLSGLLAKLGVAVTTLQRGENARVLSVVKPWSPSERRLVEKQVNAMYAQFVARVAEGRKLPRDEVERIAAGRVFTGEQALALRLVDRIGSLDDALALACERAGVAREDVVVDRFGSEGGLLDQVAAGLAAASGPSPLTRLATGIPELRAAAMLSEIGPVVALPPSWLEGPEPRDP